MKNLRLFPFAVLILYYSVFLFSTAIGCVRWHCAYLTPESTDGEAEFEISQMTQSSVDSVEWWPEGALEIERFYVLPPSWSQVKISEWAREFKLGRVKNNRKSRKESYLVRGFRESIDSAQFWKQGSILPWSHWRSELKILPSNKCVENYITIAESLVSGRESEDLHSERSRSCLCVEGATAKCFRLYEVLGSTPNADNHMDESIRGDVFSQNKFKAVNQFQVVRNGAFFSSTTEEPNYDLEIDLPSGERYNVVEIHFKAKVGYFPGPALHGIVELREAAQEGAYFALQHNVKKHNEKGVRTIIDNKMDGYSATRTEVLDQMDPGGVELGYLIIYDTTLKKVTVSITDLENNRKSSFTEKFTNRGEVLVEEEYIGGGDSKLSLRFGLEKIYDHGGYYPPYGWEFSDLIIRFRKGSTGTDAVVGQSFGY